MRPKLLALADILIVYAVIQMVGIVWRLTGVLQWEITNLGWTYTGSAIFVGVPALVLWLAPRNWAEYGAMLSGWQVNLDVGIKAYLGRIIPIVFGLGTVLWLKIGFLVLINLTLNYLKNRWKIFERCSVEERIPRVTMIEIYPVTFLIDKG